MNNSTTAIYAKGRRKDNAKDAMAAAKRGFRGALVLKRETRIKIKESAPRIPTVAINSRKYEEENEKVRFQMFCSRLKDGGLNRVKSTRYVP